ncbi:MAG: dTDP-glucose 4,6-dehydratase [Candidatus Acidiferrum sp.]
MKVLITGGAGFIGSNFIRYFMNSRRDAEVINFDSLTYAGNPESLADVAENPRYKFVRGDITDKKAVDSMLEQGLDALVNFAAETHVDRSIEDATPFLRTNVLGTQCLLDAAKRFKLPKFVQISTDEVYGSAPAGGTFTEETILDPRSPYAASKASADHFVSSYANTYGVPAVVLRCTNNYGPYQFPEKLIPLMIANAREDKSLPIYGDGLQERDWLFVDDYCSAIALALEKAAPGAIYNVSAGTPQQNLKIVRTILKHLGKPESLMQYVKDRPGHDRRYALDSSKIQRELGWAPKVSFEDGIRRTIDWYQNNSAWLDHARSGEYLKYYDRHYDRRAETFSR